VKIWTLTLEGRRKPFLEHVDNAQAAETIRRTIDRTTAKGLTVIVNVVSRGRLRVTVEEVPNG